MDHISTHSYSDQQPVSHTTLGIAKQAVSKTGFSVLKSLKLVFGFGMHKNRPNGC